MLTRKFFISWLVCSITMFTLSYVWHGIILNDFMRLDYPENIFLTLSVIVYFVIGFIISALISFVRPRMHLFLKGSLFGGAVGVFIFLTALIFGISFNSTFDLTHILFDLGWQVAEQGMGGFAGSLAYLLVARHDRMLAR